MSANKGISFDEVDFNAACEKPHEFQVLRTWDQSNPTAPLLDKNGEGVYISVLGEGAEKVKSCIQKEGNLRRKLDKVPSVEEDEEFIIEAALARTHGWRGFTEPFTPENARKLYRKNPYIRRQVIQASNKAGDFLKV